MKLVWKTKDGEKTITKVKIGDKLYKIKGISNVKFSNSKNLEKVVEVGEEINEDSYKG